MQYLALKWSIYHAIKASYSTLSCLPPPSTEAFNCHLAWYLDFINASTVDLERGENMFAK